MGIRLTRRAAAEVKSIIKEHQLPEGRTHLRVGVKPGGCSGLAYILDLTEESAGPRDHQIDSEGLRILCDSKSYPHLDGTEIDFQDGQLPRGFVFNNPNAAGGCDCGSSFRP